MRIHIYCFFVLSIVMSNAALADSSSPKLAAYYDRHMAIVSGVGYAWTGRDPPAKVVIDVKQVGVGRDAYYALLKNGNLVLFQSPNDQHRVLMENVAKFSAGQSGVLVITTDHVLWWLDGATRKYVADDVATAAVGDQTV